jgi:hypothetical protein
LRGLSATLGLRVRTGRAIAVVLAGSAREPRFVARRELRLHDPSVRDTGFPYHAALEKPEAEARAIVERLSAIIRKVTSKAVRALADEHAPRAAGIVVASLTDPATIKNPHMHAHASEGRLFWEAVAEALKACGIEPRVHVEKALKADAAMKKAIAAMGKEAGPPWRAYEKSAALAAWMALKG